MPFHTEAEKLSRAKAKLKFYNVRGLTGLNTLTELKQRRIQHNEVIHNNIVNIDEAPRHPSDGIYVGDYRHSNWVPFPRISYPEEIPYKHAVKAHFIDGALEFYVVNTTRDGIRVGKLDAYPVFLEIRDIIFEPEFILTAGRIDIKKIRTELEVLRKR